MKILGKVTSKAYKFNATTIMATCFFVDGYKSSVFAMTQNGQAYWYN